METFWWAVVWLLVAGGLLGTVIPVLPGQILIFLGAWLAGWLGNYEQVGTGILVTLGILTVLGFAVDWAAQLFGARRAGASSWGSWGAMAGTVFGLFFGVAGMLFLPLIGAFAGELLHAKDVRRAGAVGFAAWVGMLVGGAVKAALSFMMAGILIVALW